MPKEDISFPSFKYSKIIKEDFEESDFYKRISKKFLFIFFQFQGDELYLKSVKFWNMPKQDILECEKVWDKTIQNIKNGDIVESITNKGIRKTFFPNKKYNLVSHVRPHAKNKYDCFELPFPDKLTKVKEYTKHCFWLNASYIKDEVYLKNE
jgi:DNA mismatch repair protein MutH